MINSTSPLAPARSLALSESLCAELLQCATSVAQLAEKCESPPYWSTGLCEEMQKTLLSTAEVLQDSNLLCGRLFCLDLLIILDSGSLNCESDAGTVRQAMTRLVLYIQQVRSRGHEVPADLLWPLNELRVWRDMPLMSDSVFCLPPGVSAQHTDEWALLTLESSPNCDAQSVCGALDRLLQLNNSEAERDRCLQQLSEAFHELGSTADHEYDLYFWTACSVFTNILRLDQIDLSPAIRQLCKQIVVVVGNSVDLSTDETVPADCSVVSDNTLCSLLCFIGVHQVDGDTSVAILEGRFHQKLSIEELNKLADNSSIPSGEASLLNCGIQAGFRLIAKTKLIVDAVFGESRQSAGSTELALSNMATLIDTLSFQCCSAAVQHVNVAMDCLSQFTENRNSESALVQCATSLISADQAMLGVCFAQLESFVEEADEVTLSDDEALDNLLLRELNADFMPLRKTHGHSNQAVDWLGAVLLDATALSSYLSDSFLARELKTVRKIVSDPQSLAGIAEPLNELAEVISAYLQSYVNIPDREALQGRVTSAVAELVKKNAASTAATRPANDIGAQRKIPAAMQLDVKDNMRETADKDQADKSVVCSASIDFGNECNTYVDIIQQALDTALGSSGNLAPDKTVVNALKNMHSSVASKALFPLLSLLEPLALVLGSAEESGRTLSQSDTLLVQESIVAITLGIDSLVNQKPMPELISDVTARMAAIAADGKHRLRSDIESAGLIDVFVEEAEELLQRLFELVQRWRGAPHGGSKLQSDISRLLHTLKGSADTVGLTGIANLVHCMETALVGLKSSERTPSTEFFELILETVETVNDDVDRIRNAEQQTEHHVLVSRLLSVTGPESQVNPGSRNDDCLGGPPMPDHAPGVDQPASDPASHVPVFGSARYFTTLESSRKLLNRNHADTCALHEEFRTQIDEFKSALHGVRHLYMMSGVTSDSRTEKPVSKSFNKSMTESLSDLEAVKTDFENLLLRARANIVSQTSAFDSFNSLVSTADMVSVASLRARLESVVRQAGMKANKLVEFELRGVELQIERRLYSDLLSPLEQLLVNAVVHGIESAEQRKSTGKKSHGSIVVVFEKVDRNLVLSVRDDGAGVDVDRLRQVVGKRKGVDVSGQSDSLLLGYLTEQEVSTSSVASRAAGRGVGLDIVRETLFRYCGTLEVVTKRRVGTTFNLTVPQHEFTEEVLLVVAAGQYFALSCSQVVEVKGSAKEAIGLSGLLGLETLNLPGTSVVECRVSGGSYILQPDSIVGRRMADFSSRNESLLKGIPAYRGVTVIEGQQVALLLNLDYLLRHQGAVRQPGSKKPTAVQTVLIVDDSVTVRASFGRALVGKSFEIILARNGLEALDVLSKTKPDAIVLDLEMPKMNGFELAEKIRSDSKLADVPLVVVTSRPKASIGDWLLKIEADMYFEKPCSESRLGRAVAELLEPVPIGF